MVRLPSSSATSSSSPSSLRVTRDGTEAPAPTEEGRWGEALALERRRRDAARVQRPPRSAAGHSSCAASLTIGGAAAAAGSRGTICPCCSENHHDFLRAPQIRESTASCAACQLGSRLNSEGGHRDEQRQKRGMWRCPPRHLCTHTPAAPPVYAYRAAPRAVSCFRSAHASSEFAHSCYLQAGWEGRRLH